MKQYKGNGKQGFQNRNRFENKNDAAMSLSLIHIYRHRRRGQHRYDCLLQAVLRPVYKGGAYLERHCGIGAHACLLYTSRCV